jgi:hypothetical protein
MNSSNRSLTCVCLLLLIAVFPAAASPILATESFTPNPPLIPGGRQEVVASFSLPSGTTFPKDHELQLQTGLETANWNIQVMVDGNNAAQQTASGSAAFINGLVLSYSANHDVRFTVTITGTVPGAATSPVTVLDMIELDNNGVIVPGSEIIISQPVAGSSAAPDVTSIPTLTPQIVATTPAAEKSPGFSAVFGILGCGFAVCLFWLRRTQ